MKNKRKKYNQCQLLSSPPNKNYTNSKYRLENELYRERLGENDLLRLFGEIYGPTRIRFYVYEHDELISSFEFKGYETTDDEINEKLLPLGLFFDGEEIKKI